MNNPLEIYRGPAADQALRPYAQPGAPARDVVDMRSWITMLRRRLTLFLAVLIAVLLLATLITLAQAPVYSASAQVAMNDREVALTPEQGSAAIATSPTSTIVDTQTEEIKSQVMATRVADALKLADDAAFNPLLQPDAGRIDRVLALFNKPLPPVAPSTPQERRQAAIGELMGGVAAERVEETLALVIRYRAATPDLAARIANEYARQFTAGQLAGKGDLNRAQVQVLQRRLEELRAQANADTARLQQYRNANNIPSTTGATLTEQEISAYNQRVADARTQLAEDQSRLATARAQLRTGSTGGDVGEALGSGVVSGLRGRQAELAGTVANLTARYGMRHPARIEAASELAEINRQIEGEIGRIVSNLEARVQVSSGRLAAISGSLSGAQGRLNQNNAAMVGLDDLQRRADASNAVYKSYLDSYRQAVAREGSEQADSRILTLAEPDDTPTSPNIPLNLLLASVIGAGLGLAAAFIAELMYPGITTGNDAEERLGTRYLGSVPTVSTVLAKTMPAITAIVAEPNSAFAEAFRNLRTAIQFASPRRVQVIAITSALPNEGKTTIAACLARSIALSGERVVLIDGDLRRRGVSRLLYAPHGAPGLIEVLEGGAQLAEALIHDGESGAHVLPVVGTANERSELLTGEAMDRLIEQLRGQFDFILIDTAPLLPIASARVLAGKSDAVVLCLRWRFTPDHAARAALRLLPERFAGVTGLVLSRVDMKKQARYGHGDQAFYYRQYKKYYA